MKEIFERRSIRKYTEADIPEEAIERLLRAAMRAPSATNRQPWEFIVIRDRRMLDILSQTHPFTKMLKEAPCAIAVCGNLERQKLDYWVQDCSAATENILLEAVHLGIGAVWLGIHPRAERVAKVQGLLELPPHIIPLNLISLGWPAETPAPMDTYHPEWVHRERW